MKVRYNQTYTDYFGVTFNSGWVAEHSDSESLYRIGLGVCEQVDNDTKTLRYAVDAPLAIDACVTEPQEQGQQQKMVSGPKKVRKP